MVIRSFGSELSGEATTTQARILLVLFACLMLIGFQLLGEILHQYFKWPLPGSVVGMLLLAAVNSHCP